MVIYCEKDYEKEGSRANCSVISEDFFQFVYMNKHILPNYCGVFYSNIDVYSDFYLGDEKIDSMILACSFFVEHTEIVDNYVYAKTDDIYNEILKLYELAKHSRDIQSRLYFISD